MRLDNVEKPNNKRWLGILAWLLVVLLGFGVVYLYNRNLELASDQAAMSAKTVAMTSNITELKDTVTRLENEAQETSEKAVIIPMSAAEQAAKAFFAAQSKTPPDLTKYSAKLMAESGIFKRFNVTVAGEAGGVSVIVKKIGDNWVPIFIGQEQPSKAIGERYSVPTGWYSTEY